MTTKKASNRFQQVTTADNGLFLEIGPGGTGSMVSAMTIQFAPSVDFIGGFLVMGKIAGVAGDTAPFLPIPYRRVNVAGAVADYAISPDEITAAGIIQVPSNGLTIALLTACTAGTCQVYTADLQGSSAV